MPKYKVPVSFRMDGTVDVIAENQHKAAKLVRDNFYTINDNHFRTHDDESIVDWGIDMTPTMTVGKPSKLKE